MRRIALIGCGAIAGNHLSALVWLPDVGIVALCDPIRSRAEAARDRYAAKAAIYTDYRKMLDEISPDTVHIATPHYLHCEMACEALSRGINVLLEKPICISEEEIERLIAAEKASNGKVCVCFQNRFNPATLAVRELADACGGVRCARASVTWDRGDAYYLADEWRGKKATEGGGVLINQAIHELDLMIGFTGTPVSVSAKTANHAHAGTIDVEDSAELLIRFESGATAFFTATTAFGCDAPNFEELYCQNGRRITLIGQEIYLDGTPYPYDVPDGLSLPGKECWGAGHVRLIRRFYEALDAGTEMPVTLESAAVPLRVLLAAYRSSDRDVTVPLK